MIADETDLDPTPEDSIESEKQEVDVLSPKSTLMGSSETLGDYLESNQEAPLGKGYVCIFDNLFLLLFLFFKQVSLWLSFGLSRDIFFPMIV